jgi:hypothetical protein
MSTGSIVLALEIVNEYHTVSLLCGEAGSPVSNVAPTVV